MKRLFPICGLLLVVTSLQAAVVAEYDQLKNEAEQLYQEGSFARAHDLYSRAGTVANLSSNETRWVAFRLADTLWRAQAQSQTADNTRLEDARRQLELLVRDVNRPEDQDQIWAAVEESLGDFYWTRRNQQNWGAAWPHYEKALDWWAGSSDLDAARDRYLSIVWRTTRPPEVRPYYTYGMWGNYLPLQILQNTLKIAQSDNDRAHAHYLIAMTLRNQGGQWEQRARVPEEFEGAIKAGKGTDWYDDALFNYAQWMLSQGDVIPLAGGQWKQEPNYPKALELFRRLVREFDRGETRYYDQALQQIKEITEPQVGVSVPHIFLPDSEIQYQLNWRNVTQIELALYRVELNREIKLEGGGRDHPEWLNSINAGTLERVKTWTHAVPAEDTGNYRPGNKELRLDEKLPTGAYLLLVAAGGKTARELILVSDATLVLKSSGQQTLIYFCNALDGSPLGNGRVKLWEQWWDDSRWTVREYSSETDSNGLAVFQLNTTPRERNRELLATAIHENRQAFASGNSFGTPRESRLWRIYAYTDRPAYRPGETANWKFTARVKNDGSYSTPSDRTVEYEIHDPRGAKVTSDKVVLNAFGSAWGELKVTDAMPLGEYRITFWNEGRGETLGGATLFRLEEYKLPEFKVTVQTPEEKTPSGETRRKAFRVGETVEATIQAEYYFGGPVSDATVEVVVHQNPFWMNWHEPRTYPWLFEDMDSNSPYGRWRSFGPGQIVKREMLKTDATGKVTVSFETPENSGQDFEYRIEARVTDASRREIVGNGTVRVTRQRYYVHARAEHNLYRPQDKVTVTFRAQDANEEPMPVEGRVKVTRDYWYEIWIAPDGREVKGDELKQLQSSARIWPPPPQRPDQKGWRLKFRGYEHDDVLSRTLKTGTNGTVELEFTPERLGYYRVSWTSDDAVSVTDYATFTNQITAETTVWVADNTATELGYHHGGVEIIADKDTFRVGQRAPVMLVANTPGRYVLFTVEGEELYSYQLIHLTGTVKLVELPIEERHTPNIFLGAAMVSDREFFVDNKQVVVPPTRNFLTVEVTPDRDQYRPRDEGRLTVTTTDHDGKPVSAQVALSLVDESVFYIQKDYAGDPRQFFFGTKREQRVQTQSTFQQKSYAKLVEADGGLIDERDKEARLQASINGETLDSLDRYSYFDTVNAPRARREAALGYAFGGGGGGFGGANVAPELLTRGTVAKSMAAPAMAMEGLAVAQEPAGEEPAVVVRSDFRSTVFWQPDIQTDANGHASVNVKYPDSTTSWKATARAATSGNQFGIGEETTRTRQPLIVRLQAPRFFVVGDKVTISAVVNNNNTNALTVRPDIELAGSLAGARFEQAATVNVPANGEARADWVIAVSQPGEARIKVSGRAGQYTDAMEKNYTVFEHGIEKFIAKSGKAPASDVLVKLDLPRECKPGTTSLTVQVTPSLAVTMLDALPYLIDFPYGCTEQTMSRFLPAAITAKTLRDLGLEPADIMGHVFGGIETNSAAATHPRGKRDLSELDQITKAGLERLYDFQHGDGGWGWWKEGESDHWMTAYVVWGLTLAKQAGVDVRQDTLDRGLAYLDKELVEEESNYDMQAFMLHALAANHSAKTAGIAVAPSRFQTTAFDNLWSHRDQLNAYTRALLALSAHYFQDSARAKTLIANLENGVQRDERPDTSVIIGGSAQQSQSAATNVMGTAHWGEDGIYWRWSDGGVEATAFALRALLAIDPTNRLVEPVSNWLIKNRRGAQWNSTRDTAIVVLAMNDYLRASGELTGDAEYEVLVNGTSIARRNISGADVFQAPSRFQVDSTLVRESNEIRIRQSGRKARPLYFACEARFFSTEEPVSPAGNEIFVKREYFKLVGRPTLLKGYVYDKEPLGDGESVQSGERVQTLLTIETKNNYEYLIFEDLKPAGFEAVELRSGEDLHARELKSGAVTRKFSSRPAGTEPAEYVVRSGDTLSGIARINRTTVRALSAANNLSSDRINAGEKLFLPRPNPVPEETDYTGRQRWVYRELRDRKVALFIDKLPQGVWEIRYDMRAEVPGEFHALPVLGQAMYVPEIRCNGEELRLKVTEME